MIKKDNLKRTVAGVGIACMLVVSGQTFSACSTINQTAGCAEKQEVVKNHDSNSSLHNSVSTKPKPPSKEKEGDDDG